MGKPRHLGVSSGRKQGIRLMLSPQGSYLLNKLGCPSAGEKPSAANRINQQGEFFLGKRPL